MGGRETMSGIAVWHLFLIVFYGGAIVASARAWAGVWRGQISYSELRDVTGIGDRAALRRLFGLAGADGRYKVSYADVVRRRRKAGMVLTNLPVVLLVGAPLARSDQDPGANPPNCSAADLEGVRAGVSASTSAYLFTHPDVNAFFTGLKGLSRSQVAAKARGYLDSHPDVKADLTGIRQPLVDIKERCGAPPSP